MKDLLEGKVNVEEDEDDEDFDEDAVVGGDGN